MSRRKSSPVIIPPGRQKRRNNNKQKKGRGNSSHRFREYHPDSSRRCHLQERFQRSLLTKTILLSVCTDVTGKKKNVSAPCNTGSHHNHKPYRECIVCTIPFSSTGPRSHARVTGGWHPWEISAELLESWCRCHVRDNFLHENLADYFEATNTPPLAFGFQAEGRHTVAGYRGVRLRRACPAHKQELH